MHRNQFRLGRLGALWVLVVASAFAWAPSASAASQPSQAVGVIPGPIVTTDSHAPCGKFIAPDYGINEPGESLPGLEINWFERVPGDCTSTGYTWAGVGLFNRSTLAIDGVTPAALAGFDTLVLYGARWSSFDAASKAAINDFARTHKVVIWDSDSTVEKPGPDHVLHGQDYSTYLVPFVTFASGGQKASSETPAIVVGGDLLNSPTAINDAWLANEPHAIGDMTVMRGVDPSAWTVSIYAHNATLAAAPGGAPSDIVLAWARGDQATGTGLTIYSGIDADALDLTATQLGPIPRNEALASFQNQLAAAWCTAAPCPTPVPNRTISIFPSVGGTVSANPPGSACGPLCYAHGTSVTLAVAPNANAVFSSWGGACAARGSNPVCTVVLTADVSVSASFVVPTQAPHRITVTRSGDGQGTVTSSPPGVDCGVVCAGNFFTGQAVSLTATPEPGSVFLGWSGACVGNAGCSLTSDADRAVTAVFSTQPRRCTVTARTAWFHGVIALRGTTNVPGATGVQALNTSGKQVGLASKAPSAFSVNVDTRKLPTNRTSGIRVRLLNGSTVLCTVSTSLKVDNTKARALKVTHRRSGRFVLISFRPTEAVTVKALGKGKKPTTVRFKNTKRHTVRVLGGVKRARVQLIDRAKNLRTFYVTIR